MVDEVKSEHPKRHKPDLALATVVLPYSDNTYYVTSILYGGLFGSWGFRLSERQMAKLHLFLQTTPATAKQLKLGLKGGLPLFVIALVALSLASIFPAHRTLIVDYTQLFIAVGFFPYLMTFLLMSDCSGIRKYTSEVLEAEKPVHQPPYEAIRFLVATRKSENGARIGAGVSGAISFVFLYFIYQLGQSFIELFVTQNSYLFPTKYLVGMVMGVCLSLFLAFWILAIWLGDVWLCHRRFRLLHGRPLAKPDLHQLDPQTGKIV